jgi:hypothetical protein
MAEIAESRACNKRNICGCIAPVRPVSLLLPPAIAHMAMAEEVRSRDLNKRVGIWGCIVPTGHAELLLSPAAASIAIAEKPTNVCACRACRIGAVSCHNSHSHD